MAEQPRPLNLGEILDRTAQFYRARFLHFLGIALLPTGVLLFLAAGFFLFFSWFGSGFAPGAQGQPDVNSVATRMVALGLISLLGLVAAPLLLGVTALSTAALTHAAASTWLDEKLSIRASYARAWKRGWQFVLLTFLEGLLVYGISFAAWTVHVMLLAGVGAAFGAAGGGASEGLALGGLTLLVVAALVSYAVWMSIRLSLAFPACVVEGISAAPSISRSAHLSLGSRGRILLLYLLGVALNWILSLAITVPGVVLLSLYASGSNPQRAQTAGMWMVFLFYGGSIAVQAFTKPVYAIAQLLFYFDQRIRKEGFDIEWMMHQAGLVVPQPPQPEAVPWTAAIPASSPPPAEPQPEEAHAPTPTTEPVAEAPTPEPAQTVPTQPYATLPEASQETQP